MKSSRTSLNKPFYDWIKQVREADKKIEELEDKLYYYNVKLVGYNSPSFEPRLSNTKPEYKDKRYIWLDKIFKIENEIIDQYDIKNMYLTFEKSLTTIERIVLSEYVNLSLNYGELSRVYFYQIINRIAIKYLKKYSTWY